MSISDTPDAERFDEHFNERFDSIELADAVQAVRDELLTAAARSAAGQGSELEFEVGDIQMEFTVELRKELKGGTKVKAWLLEAGADAGRSSAQGHKVSFTLKARDARTGGPWKVRNDEAGDISGFGGS